MSLSDTKFKARTTPVILILISIGSVLTQVSLNYVLSKNSSIETFGEYRSFLAWVSFSGIFHFGLVDGVYLKWLLNSEKPKSSELLNIVFIQIVILAILSFGFQKINLIIPVCLQIFIQNLLAFSNNVLIREQKFILNSAIILVNQGLLTLLVLFLSAHLTIEFIILLYNSLFFASTTALLCLLFLKRYIIVDNFSQVFNGGEFKIFLKDNLSVGLPILLTGLVFVGFQNLDKVILAQYYTKYEFGLYSFGYTIINIVVGIVLSLTNLILRKFIETPIKTLEAIFTKLTCALAAISIIFVVSTPIFFQIIKVFIPQYLAAKSLILSLSSIILPYVLLQLLIFNLFKSLNSYRAFFYNSLVHLVLLIVSLFASVTLYINIEAIPYVLLTVFFSWYAVSEYLLINRDSIFRVGIAYRLFSVVLTIFINILYVTYT